MPVKTTARLRVALLSRVSTTAQHVDAQTAQLRAEAERRNYEIATIEEHVGTGRKVDRPGLSRVLALAEAGEIDVLLVAELSRIGRSLAGVSRVIERLSAAGCALVSMREAVDITTPTGKLLIGVLASVAQWESDILSRRTSDALQHAKTNGRRIGNAPFGAMWGDEGLVPEPAEAQTLRRALRLRDEHGTWKGAAERLNAEGRLTRTGRPWKGHRLSGACRNERVAAMLDLSVNA